MRFTIAVIGVVCLVGGAAQASTVKSGLYGKVTRGPITPVCIAELPCSAPVSGAMIVFSRAGHEVARTRTSTKGTYRVALTPGTYNVRGRSPSFDSGTADCLPDKRVVVPFYGPRGSPRPLTVNVDCPRR